MSNDQESFRDWHRLFGLLLTDFFTKSSFEVDVERDVSQQQQFLDVVIVRRRRGKFLGTLPDGLADLADHNLITFKSLHEALDDWSIKELLGYYVAYRKLVSPSPTNLLPEDHFRLFAVCARFPHNLAGQLPWQEQQAGVYDCQYGLDTIRVIVTGQLPREPQNAPLQLFSASPELVGFASGAYRRRSEDTSLLLRQLFERFQGEGFTMSFTMEDFRRQYVKEHFAQLTPQEQREALELLSPDDLREVLRSLSPEKLLSAFSPAQIQAYLDHLAASSAAQPPKRRRRK